MKIINNNFINLNGGMPHSITTARVRHLSLCQNVKFLEFRGKRALYSLVFE